MMMNNCEINTTEDDYLPKINYYMELDEIETPQLFCHLCDYITRKKKSLSIHLMAHS